MCTFCTECSSVCTEVVCEAANVAECADVDVDKPDERSIMTYVAKFLEKFPDSDADVSKVRCILLSVMKDSADLKYMLLVAVYLLT